jgi:hypothetical protein
MLEEIGLIRERYCTFVTFAIFHKWAKLVARILRLAPRPPPGNRRPMEGNRVR